VILELSYRFLFFSPEPPASTVDSSASCPVVASVGSVGSGGRGDAGNVSSRGFGK
jgi:hypothetical protein